MIRFIILKILLSGLFLLIALSAISQIDSTKPKDLILSDDTTALDRIDFPQLSTIGKDSFVVFRLKQARQIDAWLNEREFCLSQRKKEAEAIRQAEEVIAGHKRIERLQIIEIDVWKEAAKKRRRTNRILSAGLIVVSALSIHFILN